MPERPITPVHVEDQENVDLIKLHIARNVVTPNADKTGTFNLPFYELKTNAKLYDAWVSLPNASYCHEPIWRTDNIENEFDHADSSDICGVPRRPIVPEFLDHWNSINLDNPWSIFKMWEEFHNENSPDAVVWLDGCGAPERTITWKDMLRKAFKLALYLRKDVKHGDRIILCFPPGIDFVIAFIACLVGGYIAVPVYPPTPANQTRDGDRFLDIRKNAGVRIILTNRMYSRVARLMFRLWRGGDASDPQVRALGAPVWLPIENCYTISDSEADSFLPAKVYPWSPAFLQFTSGSTSQPKGVVVTHGSLFHNCHLCGKGFGMPTHLDDPRRLGEAHFDQIDLKEFPHYMQHRHRVSIATQGHPARVFSWLPVYHDMGLIGGLMTPLFGGCQLYQMSPVDFIKKPDLWMQCISDYRCSCCAAPNFAFELAVKRTSDSQVRTMSLGHLAGIICGAEPIRPSTMNKFFTKFSQAGLRDDVIIPAFGLAENTLIVSCRDNASERPKVLALDAEKFRRDSTVFPVPYGDLSGGISRPRTPSNNAAYTGMIDLDIENAEWLATNACDNDDTVMTLVGCGKAAAQVDIKIIDHKSLSEVPEGVVGEVWFQSASTARGYYQLAEKTKEDFYASCTYLDGTKSPDIYMRSGDTGFLFGGELFICGRLKDMLVVRGKNYYPQDIEGVLDSIPELRAGCSIAISTEDPANEELCIAAELRDHCFVRNWTGQSLLTSLFPVLSPSRVISAELSAAYHSDEEFYAALSEKMAKLVLAQVGISVSRVFLLKGRSMAKTTSGKVRRHAARSILLNESKRPSGLLYTSCINNEDTKPLKKPIDELELLENWPQDEKAFLAVLVKELLLILIDTVPTTSLPRIEVGLSLEAASKDGKSRNLIRGFMENAVFELGMDSSSMVEFGERIRRRVDPNFDIFRADLFLKCPTIVHLIRYMADSIQCKSSVLSDEVEDVEPLDEDMVNEIINLAVKTIIEHREEIDAGEYQVDPADDIKILCDRIQVSPAACYPVAHHTEWQRILLTGATGFLGQWQLRYLLDLYPKCEISCIIRASNVSAAWQRLKKTVNGPFFNKHRARIEIIPGDINMINFGMDNASYDALCSKSHVVFHTAANINLFTSYTRLRKTNVLSTIRLVEFCSTSQLKPLHFASTLGIFPAYFALWKDQYSGDLVEEAHIPTPKDLRSIFPPTAMGYPWTKVACERILERAHSQGLPVTVYRYPLTCMCLENGHTQTDNVMIPLTLSAIQEGIIPRSFIMNANTPSDVAALHSVVVGMSGVTVSKTSEPWLNRKAAALMSAFNSSNDTTHPFEPSNEPMPCIHMCDPTKVTGSKLAVWLSELGVPIDLVDDPMTLLEAAELRGDSSAIRDIIHLTRSPMAKYWFGNSDSLVGSRELPISTCASRNKINQAWLNYKGAYPKPLEVWPEPRELFKRCFLYMIKNNILTEISAGVVGQMFESGEEILQLNYHPASKDFSPHLSPRTLERDTEGTSDHQFSASIGGPYSVRGEAFAQAQSMTATVCQRAAKTCVLADTESIPHPLSTAGQLMMSMWTKYSGALAHDLMATPVTDPAKSPRSVYDQPPVLVIISTDRVAAAALQALLVEGTLRDTFRAPSLKECLPKSVRAGLAVEMLEVHEALGILGKSNTTGASLVQSLKGNCPLSTADLVRLAASPADDTLLLEMIPDEHSVPSIDCLLGLDNIDFNGNWDMRYEYHKQFLSRRDLYREGQILVLSSPLHSMHLDELQASYPNLYVVAIESDSRKKWLDDAMDLCKVINRSQMNVSGYVDNWMTLHDEVTEAINKLQANPRSLKGRFITISSEQLASSPFTCLNRTLGLLKNELVSANRLSVIPMIEMLAKYLPQSRIMRRFLSAPNLAQRIIMECADYLFVGLDRSGDLYFRGNRFARFGVEAYSGVTSACARISDAVNTTTSVFSRLRVF